MDFKVGDSVYFRHPEHAWVAGQVTHADPSAGYTCKVNDEIRKEAKQGEVVEKLKQGEKGDPATKKKGTDGDLVMYFADSEKDQPNDLLNLVVLGEATLLRCLYLRYMQDCIYTNIGSIVVALNPFNYKIPRYLDDKMASYLAIRRHFNKGDPVPLVPHSWTQAHNTYYEMIDPEGGNQCILISGESGAGKTEATKIVLKYLGAISSLSGNAEEKAASGSVGTKLTSCSPILESFGNAKTLRNDNSSRFGKFMEVKFNNEGRLLGARTTKYLLEKSRIVSANAEERVYHSFYIVLRGKYNKLLSLEDEKLYSSVNSGGVLYIHKPPKAGEFDLPEDFEQVCDAMTIIGMNEDERKSVWLCPAAILSILNLKFNASGPDACTFDASTRKFFDHAVKLLKIDPEALMEEFLNTTTLVKGVPFRKTNKVSVAEDIRDGMCKHMYDGIFAFLVDRCNDMCDTPSAGRWIGLLDIFGFEDFFKTINSFEQICINLTNEALQNHYNKFIFTADMDECRSEGIDVSNIICPDNGPCLKMLVGAQGILLLLDDCSQSRSERTHVDFFLMVEEKHGKNDFFARRDKVSKEHFIVKHYAANVVYTLHGWIEKNRDTLKDAIKLIVRDSGDKIVAKTLSAPVPVEERKGGKEPTVGGFFNQQLQSLMEVINSTNPHWIRCIKPHPAKEPRMMSGKESMAQLRSSGVLGTIEIRKAGYPARIIFDLFAKKYGMCTTVKDNPKNSSASILKNAQLNDPKYSQMGLTKVFLKAEALTQLERYKDKCCIGLAMLFQRYGRGLIDNSIMFKLFIQKHKEAILKARKEKEERERAEREAAAKAAKEAEEKERRIREQRERWEREANQKLAERRHKASVTLQRFARGGLVRWKVFGTVLEQCQAAYESKCEAQLVEERFAAREIDTQRLAAERDWIKCLNSVDHLKNKNKVDDMRRKEKVRVKERIQEREYVRKEDDAWDALEAEEALQRQSLQVKCDMIARHKQQLREQAQKSEAQLQSRTLLSPKKIVADPAKKMAKSVADDVRTKETLVDYAIHRANAFDGYFKPPAVAGPAKKVGYSSTSLFERSKNRWEREEEWLDSRAAATVTGSGTQGVGDRFQNSSIDNMFNGPHRTLDASVRGNMHRTGETSLARGSPHGPPTQANGVYHEPPWMNVTPSAATPGQRQFNQEIGSTVDWNTVFNS